MDQICTIQYKGAVAYYKVSCLDGKIFQAALAFYQGRPDQAPPARITFCKEEKKFFGAADSIDLVQDICKSMDADKKSLDELLKPSRSRRKE